MDSLILQFEILWPAMLAGCLVLSTHVPFGREVLQRGIIFLDLAIAQIAALGILLAKNIGMEDQIVSSEVLQNIVAISAAIAGSMLLYSFRAMEARVQEALIGVSFMLAATASILLLAKDPHGGETLKDLLVGQILWVDPLDLLYVGLVYLVVLFVWFRLRNLAGDWLFYPLFAISITISTQLVGVYLVFSSLIIPALATYGARNTFVPAVLVGLLGYAGGLLVSALLDLPSGATITWCLAFSALLYFLLFRRGKLNV